MSFRLSIADDVATSVRAAAREQLEGAVAQLQRAERPDADAVEAVHEARKHLKKTRALLRLVRPALGRAAYRRENATLREIAGALSATRDADVLVETVDKLAERFAGQLPAAQFDAVGSALAAEAEAARAAAGARDGGGGAGGAGGAGMAGAAVGRAALTDGLHVALARVDAWPLERADWDDVLAGAVRAYARGRDAMAGAEDDPTAERLHEWRKRAKDLWYHHRLLSEVWQPVMDTVGEEAHVLSERLGDDHDLAVLRARLERGVPLPPGHAVDGDALLALLDERRRELQEAAWRLGPRLYADRPKAFRRRLRRWLRSAVDEAQQPRLPTTR